MINLEEYQQLKRKSEKAKSDVARAEGALEQQMKKLKDDFNCDSIVEAEELLTQFENEEKQAEEQYEKELSMFKDKWDDKF